MSKPKNKNAAAFKGAHTEGEWANVPLPTRARVEKAIEASGKFYGEKPVLGVTPGCYKEHTEGERVSVPGPSALPPGALLALEDAETVRMALVEARHLIELVAQPLLGACNGQHPVNDVRKALTKAEVLMERALWRTK